MTFSASSTTSARAVRVDGRKRRSVRVQRKIRLWPRLIGLTLAVLFLGQNCRTAAATTEEEVVRHNPSPPKDSFFYLATGGPIDDTQCRMEDLEQANDSQLHTILQELVSTTFFRSFVVDLEQKCPLRSWRSTKELEDEEDEEDEFECGGGATDEEEEDEDDVPLCHVEGDTGGGGFDFGNALHSLQQEGFHSKDQVSQSVPHARTNPLLSRSNQFSHPRVCPTSNPVT
jgi:hypothetical protein